LILASRRLPRCHFRQVTASCGAFLTPPDVERVLYHPMFIIS